MGFVALWRRIRRRNDIYPPFKIVNEQVTKALDNRAEALENKVYGACAL
jgi:hypothetical protein